MTPGERRAGWALVLFMSSWLGRHPVPDIGALA